MEIIDKVITGGQTGVDRAALDAAIEQGIEYGGWCPKGGWAEDQPISPGLLSKYPKLSETPSPELAQRTEWNVRDSTATLVLLGDSALDLSQGTTLTYKIANDLSKPVLVSNIYNGQSLSTVKQWITGLGRHIVLNVAGPRESECPGIYLAAKHFIVELFSCING